MAITDCRPIFSSLDLWYVASLKNLLVCVVWAAPQYLPGYKLWNTREWQKLFVILNMVTNFEHFHFILPVLEPSPATFLKRIAFTNLASNMNSRYVLMQQLPPLSWRLDPCNIGDFSGPAPDLMYTWWIWVNQFGSLEFCCVLLWNIINGKSNPKSNSGASWKYFW